MTSPLTESEKHELDLMCNYLGTKPIDSEKIPLYLNRLASMIRKIAVHVSKDEEP